MNANPNVTRWFKTGLLVTLLLSTATSAFAGHGRRYKGVGGFAPQRVIIRERSSAGPAIAGLIGGFILGAALTSNAEPVYAHHHYYSRPVVEYRYYDPYDAYWYDSLDECHFRYGHPRIIQVIDVRSGRMVRQLRYHDGGWHRFGDDEGCDD